MNPLFRSWFSSKRADFSWKKCSDPPERVFLNLPNRLNNQPTKQTNINQTAPKPKPVKHSRPQSRDSNYRNYLIIFILNNNREWRALAASTTLFYINRPIWSAVFMALWRMDVDRSLRSLRSWLAHEKSIKTVPDSRAPIFTRFINKFCLNCSTWIEKEKNNSVVKSSPLWTIQKLNLQKLNDLSHVKNAT